MINKFDHTTPRKVTQKASLSGVVDEENLMEVFGIVVRKSYRRDGGEKFAWDAMTEIARSSGDSALAARIDELYTLCMLGGMSEPNNAESAAARFNRAHVPSHWGADQWPRQFNRMARGVFRCP
jgi:hypothetical protein